MPDGPINYSGGQEPPGNQPPWGPPPHGQGPGPAQWPGGSPQPPQSPQKGGRSPWRIVLIILGIVLIPMILVYAGCLGWVTWMTMRGPEIYVVSGNAVKPHHMTVIEDLGYLEPDEEIVLFYSPALVDVRDHMVFLTNQKLVLHNTDTSGTREIPYDEIQDATISYQGDFLNDSQVVVTLDNGDQVMFPVSADRGGDQQFLRELQRRAE